jgi:hypothetical protein
MDDRGPRLRHLTKPAQLDKQRFTLEWVLPLEPGLSTHVTVFDMECFPPHSLAVGEGADEAEALLALWTALNGQYELVDAIAVVAETYCKRTGRFPEPPESGSAGHDP